MGLVRRSNLSDRSVLVVEDKYRLGDALSRWLRNRGAKPRLVCSLTQARVAVALEPIDVALIDLELPDGGGIELVSEITRQGTPVIAISGYLDAERMVALQLLGAAMLPKPWTEPALVALLDRALEEQRRSMPRVGSAGAVGADASRMSFSPESFSFQSKIRIDTARSAVTSDGTRVVLTRMQLAVLELLLARTDEPVSSQDLALALGYLPHRIGVDAAVRRHVHELRRRLGALDLTLGNRRGFGYYLAPTEFHAFPQPKFSHSSHTSRPSPSARFNVPADGGGTPC